ncbi:hypothetical protein BDR26DRAFT_1017224 [Obelidium mucronatum]|nr:hypothetical protein BDR26DRAFT_1017224 [Obelidium mucronatum]
MVWPRLLQIPRPLEIPTLLQILLLLLHLVPQRVPLLVPRPLLFPWLLQLSKCPRQCQLPKCPRQCQLPRQQTRQLIPVPSQCQKQLSSSQDLLVPPRLLYPSQCLFSNLRLLRWYLPQLLKALIISRLTYRLQKLTESRQMLTIQKVS